LRVVGYTTDWRLTTTNRKKDYDRNQSSDYYAEYRWMNLFFHVSDSDRELRHQERFVCFP